MPGTRIPVGTGRMRRPDLRAAHKGVQTVDRQMADLFYRYFLSSHYVCGRRAAETNFHLPPSIILLLLVVRSFFDDDSFFVYS
jgi:hypothetical protein